MEASWPFSFQLMRIASCSRSLGCSPWGHVCPHLLTAHDRLIRVKNGRQGEVQTPASSWKGKCSTKKCTTVNAIKSEGGSEDSVHARCDIVQMPRASVCSVTQPVTRPRSFESRNTAEQNMHNLWAHTLTYCVI